MSGREYIFVSEAEFQKRLERFHYFEWFCVHGRFYGTPKRPMLTMMAQGRVPLLDIDIQGKAHFCRLFPDALSVFIAPVDLSRLRNQLQKRSTDSSDAVERRMAEATSEIEVGQTTFDRVVINDVLNQTLATAERIVAEYLNG